MAPENFHKNFWKTCIKINKNLQLPIQHCSSIALNSLHKNWMRTKDGKRLGKRKKKFFNFSSAFFSFTSLPFTTKMRMKKTGTTVCLFFLGTCVFLQWIIGTRAIAVFLVLFEYTIKSCLHFFKRRTKKFFISTSLPLLFILFSNSLAYYCENRFICPTPKKRSSTFFLVLFCFSIHFLRNN